MNGYGFPDAMLKFSISSLSLRLPSQVSKFGSLSASESARTTGYQCTSCEKEDPGILFFDFTGALESQIRNRASGPPLRAYHDSSFTFGLGSSSTFGLSFKLEHNWVMSS